MNRNSRSATDHPDIVKQFYAANKNNQRFHAECQLLEPVIEGAGILYVVDGSVPYGSEYEAEMEILRWTGQPSMALINQIHETEYFEEWKQALSQYFKIVRAFNAQTASFDRQLQLLTGFAELNDTWREPLHQAVEVLYRTREKQMHQAATIVAELVIAMVGHKQIESNLEKEGNAKQDSSIAAFHMDLSAMESDARDQVERLFGYQALMRQDADVEVFRDDLFSERSWKVFGLGRDQLVTAGIVSGAASGSMVDIGSGGLTLFLGSGIGAVLGGAGAWFGSQKLADLSIFGRSMGRHETVIGPIGNLNFPWVVLGRAIAHLRHVCERTHAQRSLMEVQSHEGIAITAKTDKTQQRQLEKIFAIARKSKPVNAPQIRVMVGYVIEKITTDKQST